MKKHARLYVLTGRCAGQVFDLTDPKVNIGRTDDNRIAIDEKSVSHRHAMLSRVGYEYSVTDLGSTNGTFVNGQRVLLPTPLQHGDKIRLGSVDIQFESTESIPDPAPKSSPGIEATVTKSSRRKSIPAIVWILAGVGVLTLGGFGSFRYHLWPFSESGPLAQFVKSPATRVLEDPDYRAAQAAEVAKDFPKLLKHAQALVAHFPEQPVPYYILGVGYGETDFFAEAINAFQRAIHLNPDYADAWDNLGWVYTRAGKYAEAVNAYKQGIRLKPTDAKAWNSLGGAYAADGKMPDAIAGYHKAIEFKPDYAEAHYNLGVACAGQGNNIEALKAFRQATKLNPNMIEAWYDLAHLSHQNHADDEAVIFFEKAIKLKPDYADAWAGLVKAYLALEQMDKAGEAASQLRKIDPAKAEELAEELRQRAPK